MSADFDGLLARIQESRENDMRLFKKTRRTLIICAVVAVCSQLFSAAFIIWLFWR